MNTPFYLIVIYLVAGSPTPIVTNTATPDKETCNILGERVKAISVYDAIAKKNVLISGNYLCVQPTAPDATSPPAPSNTQPPPR